MNESLTPRQTLQRHAIRSVLEQATGPLTVQEILERASREHRSLGLATVYRNLNKLQEAGEVRAVHLPGDPTRFEQTPKQHSHHFHCGSCETVYAIDQGCPVQAMQGTTLPGGFQVQDHSLTFYGTCPDCSTAVHA